MKEIIYKKSHWTLLSNLRGKAKKILLALERSNFNCILYGSVARGDVDKNSDIDIVIPEVISSFLLESALKKSEIEIRNRYMIQATPKHPMKAYIEIDDFTTVSFPLMNLSKIDREFYKFGGELSLKQLLSELRVYGINKKLMMIKPTKIGHIEQSIINIENQVAKNLGVSTQIVLNRSNTLQRREKIGRTGVFIKKQIDPSETFELALKKITNINPAVRRRMKKYY